MTFIWIICHNGIICLLDTPSGQDQANTRTCTAEIANQAISVDKNEVRERMKELVERVNEYFKQYPNEIELEDNN
ncbi:MAG: hypothetical protein IPK88_18235 [Saprospiraceae bacterium]|nr:hypothetical protein [Candidatus Defluviibacterium haderslevense]